MNKLTIFFLLAILTLIGCNSGDKTSNNQVDTTQKQQDSLNKMTMKVQEFAEVSLKVDISQLSEKQRQMLPLLFEAAKIMDDLYWQQAWGNKQELLEGIEDEAIKRFVMINYGPWDRLDGNKPFVEGIGSKPAGANFYPADMSKEEFEALDDPKKDDLYTLIRRDENGQLIVVPYHEAYQEQVKKAAGLIAQAAELAEDPGLKKYLQLRAQALTTDDYLASDMAWMDMKTNTIEFIIGPIENYEDGLFNYKTAYESFILLKDKTWSDRLAAYAPLLPELQKQLPVAEEYKKEVPGSDSDLNVYEALYYAGDCNAGSKTIAINLPNDPRVHLEKGSRKLQLKNSMKAKFDKILVPIADLLIDENQRKHIKFDAFFENVMFHEVGHGIGIKNTINGKGTVREALKEHYSAIEESKADILGLFIVTQLSEMGVIKDKDLMDNYVTFMAGIFRSVRFGVASSHGKANMIRFYYFQEAGAFTRDPQTGTYSVNFEAMKQAMNQLAGKILVMQGDGNYQKAKEIVETMGFIRPELQEDLNKIDQAGIPRDIVFKQGTQVLGL